MEFKGLWDWEESLEFIRKMRECRRSGIHPGFICDRIRTFRKPMAAVDSIRLMMHENPFSLACERRDVDRDSTMMKLARGISKRFMDLSMKADIGSDGR